MEQQTLHNALEDVLQKNGNARTSFWNGALQPQLNLLLAQHVDGFICPSDPQANDPFLNQRGNSWTPAGEEPGIGPASFNPYRVQGLWCPVSIGPTHNDSCDGGCAAVPGAHPQWCCHGCSWGTRGAGGGGRN